MAGARAMQTYPLVPRSIMGVREYHPTRQAVIVLNDELGVAGISTAANKKASAQIGRERKKEGHMRAPETPSPSVTGVDDTNKQAQRHT
jgi:hypothetical protein